MMLGTIVVFLLTLGALALSGARTTAYLLYFLSFVPFLSIDPASGGLQSLAGLSGTNVLFKLAVRVVTAGGALALLLRRRDELARFLRPAMLPVAFYVLWSLLGLQRAQEPWIALARLSELAVFFLVGLALHLEAGRFHGAREVVRWHALALLPISLSALAYAWLDPSLATHVGPGGLRLGHKFVEANVLGFAAAVSLLWSVCELFEPDGTGRGAWTARVLPGLVALVSAGVLVYARSRSAMIATGAGLLVAWAPWPGQDPARRRRSVALLATCAMAALAAAPWIGEWFLRGGDVQELASGTGRLGLWEALAREQVPEQPLLGAGYLMLGRGGVFEHAGTQWSNAHNTFLFALVSTGVPGLLAVVGIAVLPLVMSARRALTGTQEERAAWRVFTALQAIVLVVSVTGFGISGYPNAVMLHHYATYTTCVLGTGGALAATARRAHTVPAFGGGAS